MVDVLVIGAGPAGWAITAAMVQRGLSVRIIAPQPTNPFMHGYGLWTDEIDHLALDWPFEKVWPSVRIHVSETQVHRLNRRYGRICNHSLLQMLMTRASGCEVSSGQVLRVTQEKDRFLTETDRGEIYESKLVIDSTGHKGAFIKNRTGNSPGWQVALGWKLEAPGHPWNDNEAVLMDYRLPDDSESAREWPSFLYVLPHSPSVVFVEETSLIRRPAVSINELKMRLKKRLHRLGVRVRRVLSEERCYIPMGGSEAPFSQSIIAFGGAARMVHPGTGYMLAKTLQKAPQVSEAIVEALSTSSNLETQTKKIWSAVWSDTERATHNLHRFGSELLMTMDTPRTQEFFAAFFSLPEASLASYLSSGATPWRTSQTMLEIFSRVGWSLRWQIIRSGFSPNGRALRQGLIGVR